MKKETLADLTNEKPIKRRNLLKGVIIGFGIFFVITIGLFIYLFVNNGNKQFPLITFIPLFTLPITLLPILITLSSINKEIKARNL